MKSLRKIFMFVPVLLLVGMGMAACSQVTPTPAAVMPTVPPAPAVTPTAPVEDTVVPTQKTYDDPFAYCQAVGNQDVVDAAYSGPKLPAAVEQALRKAYNAPTETPEELYKNGSYWRCMNHQVYACFVGANLPCDSKANTDENPTDAEKDFCKEHPDSDFIPASVTGHDTIYEWRCKAEIPEVNSQLFRVDDRGYISEIWYQVEPTAEN
ncbi:MAG: hypothetical protein LWX83_08590 [Anaerolineae bacterium]|nr:hypothetical protein [Anaerolineae bacterium]